MVRLERLDAADIERHLDALAELRIAVFREYPYLYDGTRAYEERYVRGFASSPASTLIVAIDDGSVVGASTAMPLSAHGDREVLVPALRRAGYEPQNVYYFGESVLLPAYRGQGIGHRFFDLREEAATTRGFSVAAFCAVERAEDDPRKPADYVPHDAFWSKRGYRRRPEAVAPFRWTDVGERSESDKPMVFWTRELS